MPPKQIYLSKFSDKKLNKLFWAAYDLNACLCQLTAAGLIKDGDPITPDELLQRLTNEMKLRDAMKAAITGESDDDSAYA